MSSDAPAPVLVLAPMEVELAPIARRLGLHRGSWSGERVGTVDGVPVMAVRAGVGTRRARRVTELYLRERRPRHVIVAGVAGGLSPDLAVADVVVPAVVRHLDTGDSFTAHHLVGLPERRGELVTSAVLYGWDRLRVEAEAGVLAVDMETAAIAEVCERHRVKWSAVRALSDRVQEETVDAEALDLVDEDGSTSIGAAVRLVASDPGAARRLARMGADTAAAMSAVSDVVRAAIHAL